MRKAFLTIAVFACSTVLSANTVCAQIGNQSDVTGVVVSGGDVASGAFATVTATVPTIPSPAAVASVRSALVQAAASVVAQVNVAAGAPAALPGPVAAVLGCVGQCAPQVASLTTALQGAGGVPAASAQALTASLNDLAGGATMSAPQLASAITTARGAFQQLIAKADVAYLTSPPKEIVAIHALLVNLITAANAK